MAEGHDTASAQTGRRLGLLILVILAASVLATVVARRRWWLLPVASAQGAEIDRLFYTTLAVTGVAFILVHLLLGIFAWRYADRGQRASYWHDNRTLELTWTLVPAAVLVTLISMGAVVWTRVVSAPPADAMTVEIRGEQFTWLFRYPGPDGAFGRIRPELISGDNPLGLDPADPAARDDIVTRELHLIVNRPVQLRIRSKDVIHSFFVPAFRLKQDAVPGMTTSMWFVPTREGVYEAACAELCGVGHYVMKGKVKVERPQAFAAWLASQRQASPNR
ncbi:MAG: cytochrome c oxidase subunit II [bacterium]